ncbi:MAG: hypothetical protein EBS05_16715 [Proteobacteria bacterium]|nr:hypothetical protein [Pseudomonadota bacterium]
MFSLSTELHALITQPGPAALGPESRPGTLALADLNRALDELFRRHGAPAKAELIRALLLLWHDHHDASHTISQSIENPDGSLVHGILHRREPDYWNSKYWFRRVGPHPCFAALAQRATPLLASDPKLAAQILPRGAWDAFAFVDAVEAVAGKPVTDARSQFLRSLQQAETEVVLDYLLTAQ